MSQIAAPIKLNLPRVLERDDGRWVRRLLGHDQAPPDRWPPLRYRDVPGGPERYHALAVPSVRGVADAATLSLFFFGKEKKNTRRKLVSEYKYTTQTHLTSPDQMDQKIKGNSS